ncbi:MAG: alkaline phosphatase PhoX [Leptolyngbyaceae cyanobacterium]
MSKLSRRQFVMLASAAAAGSAVAPMGFLNARRAVASGSCSPASFSVAGLGPVSAKLPVNTAALANVLVGTADDGSAEIADLREVPLLTLPRGFKYTALSIRGDIMSDGVVVPGDHDGMACFGGNPNGDMILVRNHELSPSETEAGSQIGCLAPNGNQRDFFQGTAAGFGGGGTTTLVIDRQGRLKEDYISLGGTIRNCAGGPTYWRSWISCEENVSIPSPTTSSRFSDEVTLKHGYNFEVPADLKEAVEPIPLIAMGRMNHEAISTDARNGYIYCTEDRGDSCYYRFIPKVGRPTKFGDLQQGGVLQAMVIKKNQSSDCNGAPLPTTVFDAESGRTPGVEVVDTRGLGRGGPGSMLPFLGQKLEVEWVTIEDVDPAEDTLRFEAQSKGGTIFWRGEGAWYSGRRDGKHYFVCSGAGDEAEGQVWCYDPKTDTVTMVVESTDENLLDGPDNITIAPTDGSLWLCEDGSSGEIGDPNYSQRIVVVTPNGGLYEFARNVIPGDTSEFCGACFSPDGRFLFVNSQGIGITYAIWRDNGQPIRLWR